MGFLLPLYPDESFLSTMENSVELKAQTPLVTRVRAMEQAYDRACALNAALTQALAAFEENAAVMQELADYMDSGQWMKDFEADENGLLPEDLKRGVLSEDGLYNVLSEYETLKERIRDVAREAGVEPDAVLA